MWRKTNTIKNRVETVYYREQEKQMSIIHEKKCKRMQHG